MANDLGCVNNTVKHPYATKDVGRLIKAATNNWICQCIENKAELKYLEHFLKLFERIFAEGNTSTIGEVLTDMMINKSLERLPTCRDIQKIRNYALEVKDLAIKAFKIRYHYRSWLNLGKAILVLLLIFNRWRPSELCRLKKEVFHNCKEVITPKKNPEMYRKLSETARRIAGRYQRSITRGKKNAKKFQFYFIKKS